MQINPTRSWSINFFREWFPRMGVISAIRFRSYIIRERGGQLRGDLLITLRMKSPIRGKVSLREVGPDFATFDEIVAHEVYRPVIERIKNFQTVIDLGANIGLASLYFASCSPSCRIFAVEPHPGSYGLLERNLHDLIAAGRCRTLNAAVWATGTMLVASSELPADRYSGFAVHAPSLEENGLANIQGLDISSILQHSGFESVDILKVDIEGAEQQLFSGDLGWLERIKAIAIEFHGAARRNIKFDDIMASYGFQISEGRHTLLAWRTPESNAQRLGQTSIG